MCKHGTRVCDCVCLCMHSCMVFIVVCMVGWGPEGRGLGGGVGAVQGSGAKD